MVFGKLKKSISREQKGPRHVVALDIGTEFVKALIAKVERDEKGNEIAKVVGVGRKHQKLSDMYSGAIADIGGVVDNCDAALNEAETMANVTAKDTVVGIAGELVKGATTTIKYKRSNPDKAIELPELEKIVDKVQARALERAKKEMAWEAGDTDIEIKLVNAAIVNVFIDGYKVNNPVGFQGRDVSIQLFCAFAPMVHIGAIERVVYDLDLNLVNVAAEPFAVAKSVGVEKSETFSAIFIDVGGGTTDIALVNDGGVEGTRMFGIGGRSFTNSIAQSMDCDYETAEKLKLELSAGNLHDEQFKKVKDALTPTVKVWLSGVELALSEFEDVDQLPNKIMLCGGGSGLPYIREALESKAWRSKLPFIRDLNISHIDPTQVGGVIDATGKCDDYTYITPLGLLNVGLDALYNGTVSQSLISRLNRALQV